MKPSEVRCLSDRVNVIGEGPVWVAREQALYWVDVGLEPKTLLRFTPGSGQTDMWQLPYRAAGVRERAEGGLLITFQRALAIAYPSPEQLNDLPLQGVDFEHQRFNDSAVDSAGRLWIGTYDRALTHPLGELYCIDSSLRAKSVDRGFMMSNGIAFSPDNRTLYHTDTRPEGRIYAWDFDGTNGEIANRRLFMDFSARAGRPDGCAMDAEGCLWVAEIGARQIIRLDPQGKVERTIALPISRPTSVAFGGADLTTLYITSMTFGLKPQELPAQPLAGRLLAVDVGIRGLPTHAVAF